ncbi:MarR family winged helix-turn-helix transcriptional regulator [Nocardia donostiensis]|uniref:Transcriptional regulator n=1 Tax=Nocardia donostiensis TaxID=1538463 RepID=A0A1W0AY94_9NOCA|nr:MarR family winged helix-turn-helix transcriptional regulator [Nocardia donostiensis]ONM47124.1 transcriptional regulator [Nocardia donostiensis]OQS15205.1 transcriptional regulator [Nocardia donostiensis]OQS20109.1 transcriptional regulator [Nocardia donostiensis]
MSSRSTATDGGPALFRLVRFWSRRWINRTSPGLPTELRHAQHIQVVEAVAAATGAADEATITSVAHQLGLDHSGASRMVRDATAAGFLSRAESEQDRRRTSLQLTEGGERLLAEAHDWQRQVFLELTAHWSATDRQRFAGYLQRLADDLPHHR